MARVTVEDCLNHVGNRFELVLLATKRARQLANGKDAMLGWENDKPTVMALREIADGLITQEVVDIIEAGPSVSDEFDEGEILEESPPET